jgi:glutamate synthase domain-containing protein 2/glutamate synthase domain-containing protein 1/glutamate synthase domain-containing protein 3
MRDMIGSQNKPNIRPSALVVQCCIFHVLRLLHDGTVPHVAAGEETMIRKDLYDPFFEHDCCGVGFVAHVNGTRTHDIVANGITILKNLVHRGAIGGDQKTGDGAGMLTQVPHEFLAAECAEAGFGLPAAGGYGVAMLFLPRAQTKRREAKDIFESVVRGEGGVVLGWRDVPVRPDCLGDMAAASMPFVSQAFVTFEGASGPGLERKLYVARKCIERQAASAGMSMDDFYVASFSGATLNYKGMFVAPQFDAFYPDLLDPTFTSAIALVHQRYSTNTFPSWCLAQPFRYCAHNGEINTLRGNINKMNAREATLSSGLFGQDIKKLFPIIAAGGSDSAMFDNVYELLVMGGRSLEHSMMMMIPEAFGPRYHISEDKRAFYEYHASILEPWDGPASFSFTDGTIVGAALDRNGLRPARYVVTRSGLVVLASEIGVLDIPANDVLEKGRLAPGKMILVDTAHNRVVFDNEIKASVSRRKPYRRWLEKNKIELKGLFGVPGPVRIERDTLLTNQKVFGYTLEDLDVIIAPMAENAQEPVGSMGNDEALAVLSERPQVLFNYFKQLFAQVTNPPIDPYRENLVMSLMSFVGRESNLLDESEQHCRQLKLSHPILSNDDLNKLRNMNAGGFRSCVQPILFEPTVQSLAAALDAVAADVEKKVDDGCSLTILRDRGVDETHVPIPSLLAVSAVHQHLVRVGKRQLTGIVIETGEAREVMHFACLMGFGASAINPYLAFEVIADLVERKSLQSDLTLESAIENYITAVKKGLLKIMSKMGVSTIRSYKGAQIFEAVGLGEELIDRYFPGTPSRIGGIGLSEIAAESNARHGAAFGGNAGPQGLESGGKYHYREFSEKHLLSPTAVALLQKATRENDPAVFAQYSAHVNNVSANLCTLRGLFSFKQAASVPLDQVEPVESIVKRFVTSAMSFGSISKDAHETLAIAMNRLGAASNSGEGGEDEERYVPLANGDSLKSSIKQVASARFGVTSNYLVNSRELQIKMAQGAKPGEGGQLPGNKVDKTIAKVRHSMPGVMLISPPPHHDIYSIEDLAQLIFDLKNANRDARISVKLVAEAGVGTVAAGVAKGRADMVLISGHDGGTGASPLSSIKHAGIPWEIGLAETQQVLVRNRLRGFIRVQCDGQMKTGRDVVIAALLGAEEFGFGTAAVVTLGCIMMRKCHLNTCPVGVATQDPVLRKRFTGKPEYVINFMRFVAQEVRQFMAQLGFKTMDEMIGRSDLIEVNGAVSHWKTRGLDFSRVLAPPDRDAGQPLRCVSKQVHDFSNSLDVTIIEQAKVSIEDKKPVSLAMPIRNRNRTVGAMLSSEISKRYGSAGLPADTIKVKFTGAAGQSFGAFLAPGVTLELEGDANDYVGKGLCGGTIIIYPPRDANYRAHNNIVTGNVNLFGATGGEMYVHGMAGERFAVRNSGAVAVVEGLGDHGCEYMTGGSVVVLGKTGVNFAAGMSGGIAYVLDENQLFDTRCNLEMVDLEPVVQEEDKKALHSLIANHVRYTQSPYARQILDDWTEMLPRFVRVMPIDYRSALERIRKDQSRETEVVPITEEVY